MSTNEDIRLLINEHKSTILENKFKNAKNNKGETLDEKIIVYDGIVDEANFCGILFLLKEAVENQIRKNTDYVLENDSFDLVTQAKAEASKQKSELNISKLHWKELCYWLKAYKNETNTPFLDLLNQKESCGSNLAKVAIINLKKVAGLSTTDAKILENIVEDGTYSSFLKKEIEYIQPKIILCCGTFDYAKTMYANDNIDVKNLNCGARYFDYGTHKFIEFIHPSCRINDIVKYAYAETIFKDLKLL